MAGFVLSKSTSHNFTERFEDKQAELTCRTATLTDNSAGRRQDGRDSTVTTEDLVESC